MTNKISQPSDTPEAIERAMGLADLQIELLGVDMASATRDSIGALFEGHEEDPIAKKMEKRAQDTLECRSAMGDRELIELLFFKEPRGRVDIETTAFSIACDFYTLADWVQVACYGSKKLLEMPRTLIPKGYARAHGYRLGDLHGTVSINANRAFGPRKLAPVKKHELRHSMNFAVSTYGQLFDTTDYLDLPEDTLVDTMVSNLTRRVVEPLKDEISAFIFGGNQSQFSLKYFVFPLSPMIGLYDFGCNAKGPLDYWKKRGLKASAIKEVGERLSHNTNINRVLDRSYAAVELLEQKGYTRDWAVSFLCVGGNLTADWLPLAEACPPAQTARSS